MLAQVANGNAVSVAARFTPNSPPQQAADLLNVSRPYLIKLLEDRRKPPASAL